MPGRSWYLFSALLLGGGFGAFGLVSGGHSLGDIPAGTGYSAWELCTRSFHSGEAFEHVRTRYVEPKVTPLQQFWRLAQAPQREVTVRTWLPALAHERTAVFRPGLGCTMAPPGTTVAALRGQVFRLAAALPPDPRPWPLGEGPASTQLATGELERVLRLHAAIVFRDDQVDPRARRNTTALLVAREGHLVFERYGQGYERERPQLGWSMTKTLTALLAGVAAREGRLALDAPVGLPAWQGTAKAAITWRHLLNMAPGLTWDEGYGGASDATQMLFSQPDQGAWAAARPLTSTPGTVFTYSTGFSNIAMLRLKQLLGGRQALYDYYQSRLFAPLGIRSGVIEPDASGTPVGGARGLLRPVDWLRLGQLLLDGGRAGGQEILTPSYVRFMVDASPASAEYGGSIWRVDAERIPPQTRARLPDDLVWFAGYLGQHVIVAPSRRLLVLRMGVSLDYDSVRDELFAMTADLLQAP